MAQGMYLSQQMKLMQVLAPQLQQSLHLLQAPTLELQAMVEQELQQNPLLEEVPVMDLQRGSQETEEGSIPIASDPTEPPADVTYDPATERATGPADDFQAEFDRLSQLDQEWREHFNQVNVPLRHREEEEEKRQFMFDSLSTGISLQEHLLEQVRMSDLPDTGKAIAEMIIGNIDDRGYLQSKVDELAFATNVPAEQIAEVLKLIQTFYPPGVGARDLRECLMLQLERAGRTESLEYRMVADHLEALGRRRLPDIAKVLGMTVREVQEAAERISHLEPCPGREFLPDSHQYVVPELFVEKVGDELVISSNNEYIPHLRISNTYKDLMAQANSSTEVREYIREKIRAGKNIIKSLHQRQQTLLNIAREIVHRQREFMEFGVTHLKPMTMLEVAEVVGVHETTVSRAVSGKYIQTPQGVYEMKYFFTSGIQTVNGSDISNTSIKDILADMVRREDPANPLSDEQIVKYGHPILRKKGVRIERITPEIRQLVDDMLETMALAHGVGLAAQQVGQALQVLVVDVRGVTDRPSTLFLQDQPAPVDAFMPLALINPEVKPIGEPVEGPEGCLSFPELYADIARPESVEVKALSAPGESLHFRCGGLLARAIQHELDHLNGILFIDRMKMEDKQDLRPQLTELQNTTKLELARR